VVTLALIASWDPGEFGISDLLERIQEGAPLMAVMIVAGISQVYVLAMLVIGLIGVSIPPQIVRCEYNYITFYIQFVHSEP